MRLLPQYEHADLGLIEDDNTPDMRRAPAATEALRENNYPQPQIGRTVMTTVSQCRHCTVPLDSGDTCKFCKSYVPPEQPRTWRDVADQLTPEQITYLEHWADNPIPVVDGAAVDDAAHQDTLLYTAQKFVEANAAAVEFAHIAPPPDETVRYPWSNEFDGSWSRYFVGTTRTVSVHEVIISGTQCADGSITRTITADLEDLDPDTARQAAAALNAAADEIEGLQ